MGMRLHELHAAIVHAPLGLVPAAAVAEALAASNPCDRSLARVGRMLLTAAAGSAVFAGVSGLSASQEVRARSHHAKDMMLVHGMINATVTGTLLGLTALRVRRPPSWASAATAALAGLAAAYSGYIGAEMVYGHGVGIKAMPGDADAGVEDSPSLVSAGSPGRFLRDAAKGTAWVFTGAARVASRRRHLDTEALTGA
ncbi:MAG: DUF2231 domain-containing protein [Myxococcota bacterium]